MPLALWGAALCVSLGALILLLGIAIFREDPRQRTNRWAALMLSFGGLGAVLVGLSISAATRVDDKDISVAADTVQYFAYLWEFFFPALLLFVLVFPREPRWFRRVPAFEFLVMLPYLFHSVLSLVARWTNKSFLVGDVAAHSGWVGPLLGPVSVALRQIFFAHVKLFPLVNLAYVVVTLLVLGFRLREVTSPRLKDQLRAISLGLGGCLILYSLAVPLPAVFGVGAETAQSLRSAMIVVALALGSGGIAYAIVRYRFLDAGFLVRRSILFLLPALALILAYLGISSVLMRYANTWAHLDPIVLQPLLLLVLVSTISPAVSRLEEVVEGFLSRDVREGRTVIQNLSKDIVTELDLATLGGRLTSAVGESLLLERAALLTRAGVAFAPVASFERGTGVSAGSRLAADPSFVALAACLPPAALGPQPALIAQLVDGCPAESLDGARTFIEQARRLGFALIVPVRHREEPLGCIALGPKLTGARFSREDLTLLETLANQTGAAIRTASLYAESVRRIALEEELTLARQIQFRYLPTTFPRWDNLEVFGTNQPSKQVGGDYFDVVTLDDGLLAAIADVSGKGVPAALVMSMMQASLRTQAGEGRSVSDMLERVNRLMLARGETGMFATCFLAQLSRDTMTLSYSNAGHNPPILLHADGGFEVLSQGGLLLGVFDDPRLSEGRVRLAAGDRLVLYTDGVTEARSPSGEFYDEERLAEFLIALDPELSAEEVAHAVKANVSAFTGTDDFEDDMTLVVMRVPAPVPTAARVETVAEAAEPALVPGLPG
jgi:sigma-B regulation protein RsbU (phosphoserine phosphatase)